MRIVVSTTLIGGLSAMLAACIAPAPVAAPVPPRDIQAAGAKLAGATVLSVDRFHPVTAIGKNCAVRPLEYEASNSDKLAKAIAAAQAYSDTQKGVGLVILQDGKILYENYAEGVTAETPTDSYSMHKSVMALTIGIAIEEGIIGSMHEPIELYIDEWKNDPRGKITIKQLLNMESGLKLYSFTDPGTKSMELLLAADINAVALDHPLADQPGGEFRYNNVNSQIAGIALERALIQKGRTGYAAYLEQKLWCPLGNDGAKLWLDREGGSPHYYSGLFTGSHNWARVGEMIRKDGKVKGKQVVPALWIKAMAEHTATNPNYGLHVWLGSPTDGKRRYSKQSQITVTHSAPYLANDVMFFDGFGGQRVYIIPSKGMTIVRTGQVNLAYDDSVIVNLVLEALEN